jgi:hypothetical protein
MDGSANRKCHAPLHVGKAFSKSITVWWAILVMDRDPDVLEFYDQPHNFKLRYVAKSGKMQDHYYTPDFLVLRKTFVCFGEPRPKRYVVGEPPIEHDI